jgi:hypothetical protein
MPRPRKPEYSFPVRKRTPAPPAGDMRLAQNEAIQLWSNPDNRTDVRHMYEIYEKEFCKSERCSQRILEVAKLDGTEHLILMQKLGEAAKGSAAEFCLKGLDGFAHRLVIETLTVAVRFRNERQLTTAFTDKKSRKPRQVVRRDIMRMRKEALQRVLRSAAASPNAKTAFGRRIGVLA